MKHLNDDSLHLAVLEVAKAEKLATFKLLEYLHEIDKRRIYSVRGFESMFAYVVKYLGYSSHQAHERVSSMRLAFRVEEVKESLKDGRLNLTTIAQLATHVRQKKLTPKQTLELLPLVESKSKREIEKILEPEKKFKKFEIEADDECLQLLERFKELEGNPALSVTDCLKLALKQAVRTKEAKNQVKRSVPPAKGTARYVPVVVRQTVSQRSAGQCEYRDALTGRRCEGRHGVQFEHKIPFAMGGATHVQTMEHLCPSHNKLRAIQAYGKDFMQRWIT